MSTKPYPASPPFFFRRHIRLRPSRAGLAPIVLLMLAAIWCSAPARAQIINTCGNDNYYTDGSATVGSDGQIVLTDGRQNEAGSIFCGFIPITAFRTDFTFQLTNPVADGFTFAVFAPETSDDGGALGDPGGGLGYAGIGGSAILFDLYKGHGVSSNSVGVAGQPLIDLTGTGIDLHSGHPIDATVLYDEPNLNLTLTDTVTHATWTHLFMDYISARTGLLAEIGFTGGTGNLTATQKILKWSFPTLYCPKGFSGYGCSFDLTKAERAPNLSSPDRTAINLANGKPNTASSFFMFLPIGGYPGPDYVATGGFDTEFTFQISNAVGGKFAPPLEGGDADGFAFVIKALSKMPVGKFGGGLGYTGIDNSVAIKFDLHNNRGEGTNSTGLYTDGEYPGEPSIDLTGTGIDLHSPDIIDAHIIYHGTTLSLTLTDTVTKATWSHDFPIDILATTISGIAYVGFTGATGAKTSTIQILSWTYLNQ